MDINDAFPSKYLKASDLKNRSIRVKILNIVEEILGDKAKVILYFVGKEKGMVANRTNCMTLAEAWGPETDNWIGGNIEIFSTKVPFQGKLTDSMRVRPLATPPAARGPAPTAPAQAPQPSPPPPVSSDDYGAVDDDIVF